MHYFAVANGEFGIQGRLQDAVLFIGRRGRRTRARPAIKTQRLPQMKSLALAGTTSSHLGLSVVTDSMRTANRNPWALTARVLCCFYIYMLSSMKKTVKMLRLLSSQDLRKSRCVTPMLSGTVIGGGDPTFGDAFISPSANQNPKIRFCEPKR